MRSPKVSLKGNYNSKNNILADMRLSTFHTIEIPKLDNCNEINAMVFAETMAKIVFGSRAVAACI